MEVLTPPNEVITEPAKSVKKERARPGVKFELIKSVASSTKGQYFIRMEFANGRILSSTETYRRPSEAKQSLASLISAIQEGRYTIQG